MIRDNYGQINSMTMKVKVCTYFQGLTTETKSFAFEITVTEGQTRLGKYLPGLLGYYDRAKLSPLLIGLSFEEKILLGSKQ